MIEEPPVSVRPWSAGTESVGISPPSSAGKFPRRVDRGEIRRNNLEVVTRWLAASGRASRADIAAATGLTNSTVARLVAELQDLGLVREVGTAPVRGAGRPGAWVQLDGQHLLAVGCEINVHRVVVRVCDLGGRVRAHIVREVDGAGLSARMLTQRAARLCLRAIAQAQGATVGASIVNVTVAVPGVVDHATDSVLTAPNLHWTHFPLAAALAGALGEPGVPVTVGNDANFAALAEFWSGPHMGTNDLVYVTGDVGIGGGIVVGGRLLTSSNGQAGEVGHMTIDPAGPTCACGRRGCWESYIGLAALRRSAEGVDATLSSPSSFTADLARRATAEEPAALAALTAVGTWVGVGVANLVNVLGSEKVILGGYFFDLAEWILPAAQVSLATHAFINRPVGGVLTVSTLGSGAAATGAALYAVDKLLSNPTVLHGEPHRMVVLT